MPILTKPAVTVFAGVDSSNEPRRVDNLDAQVWGTEIERIIDGKVETAALTAEIAARVAGDQQSLQAVEAEKITRAARDQLLQSQIDVLEAGQSTNQIVAATWSVLSGISGSTEGQRAEVLPADTGTHTDPVVGGTVNNAGVYAWSDSPAGWERIGDDGISAILYRLGGIEFKVNVDENEWGAVWVDEPTGRLIGGFRRDGTWFFPKLQLPDSLMAQILASGGGGFARNEDYFVLTEMDNAGNYQIISQRVADGQVFALTSENSNSVNAIDDDDVVYFSEFANGEIAHKYIPAEGGAAARVVPRRAIAMWGDSLTTNDYGDGDGIATRLASMLSRQVTMLGISGQTSEGIAARQGGVPGLLTVTGNQIPASGSVAVTAFSVAIIRTAGSKLTGTLAGVHGTLECTVNDTSYTFTRTVSGSVVSCPAGTPFLPDIADQYAEDTVIIWAGTNNRASNGSAARVVTDVTAMVNYLKPLGRRFLVLGAFNGDADTTGEGNHTRTLAINSGLSSAFPDQFFDVREFLRDVGAGGAFDLAGASPTTQDTTDIANGVIPDSWRTDTIHLNGAGKEVVATKIAQIFSSKGW